MAALRDEAAAAFDESYCEKALCGDNNFRVDFYFPEEETIVEVALGLQNPNSEFEKDILKAIVAKSSGNAVKRLVFIGRAGAQAKCSQPGRRQIVEWALNAQDLMIEVWELPGTRRRRARRSAH